MPDPTLTLLAAKARTLGLIAGTALVTTALVGGGTVALTAVGNEAPLSSTSSVATSATPTVGMENRSATATAGIKPPKTLVPTVVFTCDPSKNHGQNVSAYGKTLAKGPGRGQQVSQAAKSDCGKKVEDATQTAKAPKAGKPAKAPKTAKPSKPAKPTKSKAPKPTRG